MTNQTLGAGDEANGRPLLGGIGAAETSSARGGSGGLPFVGALESFARIASSIASGSGFGLTSSIRDIQPDGGAGQAD
jgi:hypothetical protein